MPNHSKNIQKSRHVLSSKYVFKYFLGILVPCLYLRFEQGHLVKKFGQTIDIPY